jgi:PAS domain S-box-containing protein
MDKELRILILEDSSADAELEEHELRKAGVKFTSKIVDTSETFLKALDEFTPDIILADYDLPTFDGLKGLEFAKEKCPDVPYILVTGRVGEEFAIETLKKGVTDYIMKGNLKRLPHSVKMALEEAKMLAEHKQSEAETRWKTALLEAQMNATIDGILIVDEKGNKVIQNQRCIDLWKIPRHIVDNQDDKQQVEFVMHRAKDPQKFVEKVIYLYTHPNETSQDELEFKDGAILYRYSAPVIGKDGTYFGRIWIFRDITERKRAEEALLASKKSLDEAQRIGQMGSWEFDLINLKVSWSDYCYTLYGLKLYEIEPSFEYFKSRVHPDDLHIVEEEFQKALQTKKPSTSELRITFPDKTYKWIESSMEPHLEDDEVISLSGIQRNITERKRAEEQIKRLNKSMGLAMEVSKAGTWDWDIANNKFVWSPEFMKLFGMPPDTVAGFEAWENSLHPEDREIAAKRIQNSINDKTELTNDYRIILPNQEIRWIRSIGRTFYDKDTPIRMTGICIDITKLKRLERDNG